MTRLEGARRMQSAGRKITGIGFTVFLVLLALMVTGIAWMHGGPSGVGGFNVGQLFPILLPLLPLALTLAFLGAALWLAGWIVEGFVAGGDLD